jgi:shikimate kinase
MPSKPIVLMGFKHVGKSVIGRALGARLKKNFLDLDEQIEALYFEQYHEHLNCRQIMQAHGQHFFQNLETVTLEQVLEAAPGVLALGGGAALAIENQTMLEQSILVHIQAPADPVFERIQKGGRPAFFNPNEDLRVSFDRLWNERVAVYESIAVLSILNTGSVEEAVEGIMAQLDKIRL